MHGGGVLNHSTHDAVAASFAVNFLALHNAGRSRWVRDALMAFIGFREEVILRRSRYRLNKARERGHLLIGLAIAVANIDEVIRVIRASADAATARMALMERDWPAGDIGVLLELVDDYRNVVTPEGTVRLTEEQAPASRPPPAAPDRPERDKITPSSARWREIRECWRSWLAYPPHGGDSRDARGAGEDRLRTHDGDRRWPRRCR